MEGGLPSVQADAFEKVVRFIDEEVEVLKSPQDSKFKREGGGQPAPPDGAVLSSVYLAC